MEQIKNISRDISEYISNKIKEGTEKEAKWKTFSENFVDYLEGDVETAREVHEEYLKENFTISKATQEGYLKGLTYCLNLFNSLKPLENCN